MNDCKKCKWKDRDPKKLAEIFQKYERDIKELRRDILSLQAELRRSTFQANRGIMDDDDIPF